MNMDKLNLQIARHLQDGRKSFRTIARDLSVSENTVRSRVGKLIQSGILDIVGQVDTDHLPNHQVVVVGVKLNTMKLEEKGEEFSQLKGVVSVGVVTGRYDVILTVMLNEEFELLDFFKNEMSKVKGVRSTETFVLFRNFSWKIPYVL